MFCKGSFEAVSRLCAASTVPKEAAAAVRAYAAQGSYVLALAQRIIAHESIHGNSDALSKLERAEVETAGEFEFLGDQSAFLH